MINCEKKLTVMLRNSCITLLLFCLALPTYADVEDIGNEELKFFISQGTPVVDIREEFEWRETGIVPKSHLFTFFDAEGKYDLQAWLIEVEKITKRDNPLILICRSGRRSLLLAKYLSKNENFVKVYNVKAGIQGWKSANLLIESYSK